MTLSASQLDEALRLTGDRLSQGDQGRRVRLYVVGGTAGLLSGWLAASRSTGDVDVTRAEPKESWEAVRRAAGEVAKEQDLPETWLNNECSVYAWCLPLGWEERCECVRTYGPLEVWRIGRGDFIAAKVVSAPHRPQDLEDLIAIGPSDSELDFTADHLDRLESESLDPDQTFEDQRAILETLRGAS